MVAIVERINKMSSMVLMLRVLDVMLLILMMSVRFVHAHPHVTTMTGSAIEHAMLLCMLLIVHNERVRLSQAARSRYLGHAASPLREVTSFNKAEIGVLQVPPVSNLVLAARSSV